MHRVGIVSFFLLIMLANSTIASEEQINGAEPSWSPDGEYIAFVSNRAGNNDIWLMEHNGNNPINLTSESMNYESSPSWSPDGRYIVYISDFTEDIRQAILTDLWIVETDGENPTNLTSQSEETTNKLNYQQVWSPNGGFIAFSSNSTEIADIWVMNLRDSTFQNLTDNLEGVFVSSTWSPDSQKIAFAAVDMETRGIWIHDIISSESMKVMDQLASFNVSWSPIEEVIAFTNLENGELFLLELNSDILISLTPEFADTIINVVWSPDGTALAFEALPNLGGNNISIESVSNSEIDIWVVNVDGTELKNITFDSNAPNESPSWSPDGTQIAFSSNRDGDMDIWIMEADGSNLVNLTGN